MTELWGGGRFPCRWDRLLVVQSFEVESPYMKIISIKRHGDNYHPVDLRLLQNQQETTCVYICIYIL